MKNNERIRSWGTFLGSKHFGGRRGVMELWDED
jgi:hypothetical protein